ncbi:unnamed protein product [Haemonchus placei]|uniref:Uncharacterized protein n=1 Tax=Haemonchus placei TaxID=6290 RepID=A0A3P7Z823_HAEPC|nr:unnamed protein product [Haemonchus placei]
MIRCIRATFTHAKAPRRASHLCRSSRSSTDSVRVPKDIWVTVFPSTPAISSTITSEDRVPEQAGAGQSVPEML